MSTAEKQGRHREDDGCIPPAATQNGVQLELAGVKLPESGGAPEPRRTTRLRWIPLNSLTSST
jgi:hypothetical protein